MLLKNFQYITQIVKKSRFENKYSLTLLLSTLNFSIKFEQLQRQCDYKNLKKNYIKYFDK